MYPCFVCPGKTRRTAAAGLPADGSPRAPLPVPGAAVGVLVCYFLVSRPENETDGVHCVPLPGLVQFTATTTRTPGSTWIGTT